jgi:hypothetical protein
VSTTKINMVRRRDGIEIGIEGANSVEQAEALLRDAIRRTQDVPGYAAYDSKDNPNSETDEGPAGPKETE